MSDTKEIMTNSFVSAQITFILIIGLSNTMKTQTGCNSKLILQNKPFEPQVFP